MIRVGSLRIVTDLCPYGRQARGDDEHNLVTIVMKELQTDIHGALEWISKLHDQVAEKFLSDFATVGSFGEPSLDAQVATYIDGLGNWVRANEAWSFEANRFMLSSA